MERIRCHGEEIVALQRGFDQQTISLPNRRFPFKQSFKAYQDGFGSKKDHSDFFMGLEKLHEMTSKGVWQATFSYETRYNKYSNVFGNFKVLEYPTYKFRYDWKYYGSSGFNISKSPFDGSFDIEFQTWDSETFSTKVNCAKKLGGSWWYLVGRNYCRTFDNERNLNYDSDNRFYRFSLKLKRVDDFANSV